jgi:hypothetical protein
MLHPKRVGSRMLQACLHANLDACRSTCKRQYLHREDFRRSSNGWVRMGPRAKEVDLKDTKDVLSAILLADTFTQVCSA